MNLQNGLFVMLLVCGLFACGTSAIPVIECDSAVSDMQPAADASDAAPQNDAAIPEVDLEIYFRAGGAYNSQITASFSGLIRWYASRDIRVHRLPWFLLGGSDAHPLIGSHGTHYMRRMDLINLDTGPTIAGPIELPTVSPDRVHAELAFGDDFIIRAGAIVNTQFSVYHCDATGPCDLTLEDAPGEFATRTHYYVLGLGASYEGFAPLFETGDVVYADTGEPVPPMRIRTGPAIEDHDIGGPWRNQAVTGGVIIRDPDLR